MAYEKIGWKDYPDKTTPINAQNLNHMDDQIAANAEKNDTQDQAIQKNENDISELNLKLDSTNSNISKKQDASTAITTSNINSWLTSHIMAKTVQITTSMSPYSWKEVTVSLGITGNYIVISVEPYVVGEAMAHITNHFLDGKGNVKIDVSNAQSSGTSTVHIGAWIRYIQL